MGVRTERCPHGETDCFASRNSMGRQGGDRCVLLKDLREDYDCPFYKSKRQYELDLIDYPFDPDYGFKVASDGKF